MNKIHKQYKDWNKVPMPECIAKLPKDQRGYPIPANVMYLDGKPVFAANDFMKELALVDNNQCSATGAKLTPETVRLIGAPLNGIGRGKVIVLDAPVHVDALRYSMQVCPYLCLGKYYHGFDMGKADKFNEKYGEPGVKFINNSPVNTIPPFMLEIHPRIIKPIAQQESVLYSVDAKDILDVNFWQHGKIINFQEAIELILPYLQEPELKPRLERNNITEDDVKNNMKLLWKKKRKLT